MCVVSFLRDGGGRNVVAGSGLGRFADASQLVCVWDLNIDFWSQKRSIEVIGIVWSCKIAPLQAPEEEVVSGDVELPSRAGKISNHVSGASPTTEIIYVGVG